jgi:hypothetical protein
VTLAAVQSRRERQLIYSPVRHDRQLYMTREETDRLLGVANPT